jgi:hypothetical protein
MTRNVFAPKKLKKRTVDKIKPLLCNVTILLERVKPNKDPVFIKMAF